MSSSLQPSVCGPSGQHSADVRKGSFLISLFRWDWVFFFAACVNFAGRERHWGLPVGAGNPLQCSVLHVQADGESCCVCVCVCVDEWDSSEQIDCIGKVYCEVLVYLYATHRNNWRTCVCFHSYELCMASRRFFYFIHNALKMFACEARCTLSANLPNPDQYRSAVSFRN